MGTQGTPVPQPQEDARTLPSPCCSKYPLKSKVHTGYAHTLDTRRRTHASLSMLFQVSTQV